MWQQCGGPHLLCERWAFLYTCPCRSCHPFLVFSHVLSMQPCQRQETKASSRGKGCNMIWLSVVDGVGILWHPMPVTFPPHWCCLSPQSISITGDETAWRSHTQSPQLGSFGRRLAKSGIQRITGNTPHGSKECMFYMPRSHRHVACICIIWVWDNTHSYYPVLCPP